jgi:hypothetical protein
MLFCDFEPGWSGGDSGTGWSGGDSGTRWTPVGDLNKRYRRLQDILLSSFDLLLLKSVTRNDRRVIKLKDLKKNQDSWLSGDQFNLSSVITCDYQHLKDWLPWTFPSIWERLGVGRLGGLLWRCSTAFSSLRVWPGDNKISQVQFQLVIDQLTKFQQPPNRCSK